MILKDSIDPNQARSCAVPDTEVSAAAPPDYRVALRILNSPHNSALRWKNDMKCHFDLAHSVHTFWVMACIGKVYVLRVMILCLLFKYFVYIFYIL